MKIEGLTPILNVSNIVETFEWFAKLGWEKAWDWSPEENAPPSFGAVCNGKSQSFFVRTGKDRVVGQCRSLSAMMGPAASG